MVYQVEPVPVVHGEMAVPVQARRAVHKIQVQESHQIFQAHRWNMGVEVMEIMVVRQEPSEIMVQELWMLLHLQIVVAADHKCLQLPIRVQQVDQAL
jgi:hypothetical protein